MIMPGPWLYHIEQQDFSLRLDAKGTRIVCLPRMVEFRDQSFRSMA